MIGTVSHPITLVELDTYARDADVVFTPERHERLKEILAFNPEHGDVIAGTGGVRQFIWEIEDGRSPGRLFLSRFGYPAVPGSDLQGAF